MSSKQSATGMVNPTMLQLCKSLKKNPLFSRKAIKLIGISYSGLFSYGANFRIFVCEPCIWKLNVRKFKDCTMCYVRMRERMKI